MQADKLTCAMAYVYLLFITRCTCNIHSTVDKGKIWLQSLPVCYAIELI